jgi:two-component system, sensor histidine kinase and response regulator
MNSLIDREAALARMGGSEELLRDMIRFFLEDAPGLLHAAEKGVEDGNAEETTRAAHSLKGLAANFDATRVTDAAARLEEIGRSGHLSEAGKVLVPLRRAVSELLEVMEGQVAPQASTTSLREDVPAGKDI